MYFDIVSLPNLLTQSAYLQCAPNTYVTQQLGRIVYHKAQRGVACLLSSLILWRKWAQDGCQGPECFSVTLLFTLRDFVADGAVAFCCSLPLPASWEGVLIIIQNLRYSFYWMHTAFVPLKTWKSGQLSNLPGELTELDFEPRFACSWSQDFSS